MHIENVHVHFDQAAGAAAISALLGITSVAPIAATAAFADPQLRPLPPKIGEFWHGQGGVYAGVVRGRDGAPDYHLVLPTDPKSLFIKRAIETYGTEVQGADSDHDGLANTKAYAAAGSQLCTDILALSIDGHSDFYLPSRVESRLLWCNLPEHFEQEWYLTSTQYSADNAWYQDFSYGTQDGYDKKFDARARAVRRLIL